MSLSHIHPLSEENDELTQFLIEVSHTAFLNNGVIYVPSLVRLRNKFYEVARNYRDKLDIENGY